MKGADVLVDDRANHRDKWEAVGAFSCTTRTRETASINSPKSILR
jgi:hypothetical protein